MANGLLSKWEDLQALKYDTSRFVHVFLVVFVMSSHCDYSALLTSVGAIAEFARIL